MFAIQRMLRMTKVLAGQYESMEYQKIQGVWKGFSCDDRLKWRGLERQFMWRRNNGLMCWWPFYRQSILLSELIPWAHFQCLFDYILWITGYFIALKVLYPCRLSMFRLKSCLFDAVAERGKGDLGFHFICLQRTKEIRTNNQDETSICVKW